MPGGTWMRNGELNHSHCRTVLFVGAACMVLGAGAAGALAPTSGGAPLPAQPAPASCTPPALPGSVVDVTLTDMGAMMGPGMNGGMMGHHGMGGMMRLAASPNSVPAGQVSLRVANRGGLAHEVVLMPLAPGQYPGQRPVGPDGRVDEEGSLGEAAQTCGDEGGDGIAPGAWSWTTVNLAPGRYELLCNIAGHYGSGMYAELDVT